MSHPIIDRAMVDIVMSHPFWATLLLSLGRVEEKDGTMWTDGKRLGYCPAFCEKIGRKETVGVLAHEAAHVFLKHPLRRGNRDPKLWNIACDHVVNAIIIDSGFTLPKGGLPPIRGKTAEDVYADLVKQGKQPQPQPQPNPQQGNGKPQDKPDGKGDGKPDQKPGDKGDGKGKGDKPSDQPGQPGTSGGEPSKGKPDGGGGSGDKAGDKSHEKSSDPGTGEGWGEVRDQKGEDGSGMSEAEKEAAEREANVLIKQAVTAAKRAGKMPAGMDQMVDELTEPKVDWRAVLQRFLGERAKSDYSWRRPNPRYFSGGIVMPSLDSQGIGKVVIAGDTSGSMLSIMRELVSEVVSALEVYEEQGTQDITVLWCDTQVTEQTITDAADLKPVGGGGTDFAPVFAAVRKRHSDAVAVVYITDGVCNSFGTDPGMPVLWALTERNNRFKPPFGEVMQIQS